MQAPRGLHGLPALRGSSNLDPVPPPAGRRYSVFILAVEGLGVSALLPYALLLIRSIRPKRDSKGLPAAKGYAGTKQYP